MIFSKTVCKSSLWSAVALALLAGCGKHETTGSVVGSATGAIIGASVASDRDSGTGALIGGLIGNVVGGCMGRAADDDERQDQEMLARRQHARERARDQQELERIRQENRRLRQKWCSVCNRLVTIDHAKSCPSCGGDLIKERYCRECSALFSPESGYRYCPYCRQGTRLSTR